MTDGNPQAWDPQFEKTWGAVIAKSWQDPAFRTAFEQDPKGILARDYSVKYPDGVVIILGQAATAVPEGEIGIALPWPPKPAELDASAAGSQALVASDAACCCSLAICCCC